MPDVTIPEPGDRAVKWLDEVIDHVGLPNFARCPHSTGEAS
jgi:hypothetical protein